MGPTMRGTRPLPRYQHRYASDSRYWIIWDNVKNEQVWLSGARGEYAPEFLSEGDAYNLSRELERSRKDFP